MTLGRQPCPAPPCSDSAIKRNTELLIWSGCFFIHYPVVFLEALQGETQFKRAKKSRTSIPEVSSVQRGVEEVGWRAEKYCGHSQSCCLWGGEHHSLKPNDRKNIISIKNSLLLRILLCRILFQNKTKKIFRCYFWFMNIPFAFNWVMETWLLWKERIAPRFPWVIRICNGFPHWQKGINENMMWAWTAIPAAD